MKRAQAEASVGEPVKDNHYIRAGLKDVMRGKTMGNIKRHWMLYLFLLPSVTLVGIFCYGSMFGIFIAFQEYELLGGVLGSEFVGLKNFIDIFTADTLGTYRYFRNTIYISLIRIGTNFPIILIYTLLVNEIKRRRIRSVVQTISFLPHFISWVVVGGLAYNLLTVNGGTLNRILEIFGQEEIFWYSEPKYWWGILAVSSLWKGMGWATIMYLSALGSIDGELYDACLIDGGGRFRQAISVTLPGIMNVVVLQIILDMGGIMGDNYDQIISMINGSQSLSETTEVVGVLTFNAATGSGNLSRATAFGLIQSVIGFMLVLISNRVAKKAGQTGIV